MEDYAWVVEYLPSGRSEDMRKEPLAQLVGHQFFTLLEASVKKESSVLVGTKVFVGKGERSEIDRIKRRMEYNDLTNGAREILPNVVRRIVEEREPLFVNFLNKAGPISMRVHQLDLLPGIGKRNMEEILKEREKAPFESFEDMRKRVHTVSDPAGVFVHRIISELEGKERYYLFTKPPQQHRF
jgi:putative nucleotide binding protein